MSATSLAYLGAADGQHVTVFVRTQLSQEALRLYGFIDSGERQMFDCLITTSGVGSKLALAILSTFDANELAHVILTEDRASLTRIPGVGKKTAERLLLELKDRIGKGINTSSSNTPSRTRVITDVISALVNLGFTPQAAEGSAKEAQKHAPGVDNVAALVKEALRRSRPKSS
jgi:Holliday junction DNA helicase RuvA